MDQDLVELLEDLDLPVLLVSGQQDPIIQVPDIGVLAGLDYNVYAYALGDAQHYPLLGETSKFYRLLRDFLRYRDDWDRISVRISGSVA